MENTFGPGSPRCPDGPDGPLSPFLPGIPVDPLNPGKPGKPGTPWGDKKMTKNSSEPKYEGGRPLTGDTHPLSFHSLNALYAVDASFTFITLKRCKLDLFICEDKKGVVGLPVQFYLFPRGSDHSGCARVAR